MKTCSRQETDGVEREHVEALLGYLPGFEEAGFCPGGVIPLDEDGYPEESFLKAVSRFLDACYKNGFIVRFDWESWDAEARAYLDDPARMAGADLAVLRRLLTWHVRQNRFERDHLAGMIAKGHIGAILRRLRDLQA